MAATTYVPSCVNGKRRDWNTQFPAFLYLAGSVVLSSLYYIIVKFCANLNEPSTSQEVF